jgi:hypothetical protein
MLDKRKYLIIGILIIVAFLLGYFSGKIFAFPGLIGKVIQENEYTWTKAICNSGKCIDVLVTCKNGQVASLKPVSEVQYIENLTGNTNESF